MYRCYVVCVEYWWITILPLTTSLSAFGVYQVQSIALPFAACTNFNPQNLGLFLKANCRPGGAGFSEVAASSYLTVSTNIIVTAFITFRLTRARRIFGELLPSAADLRIYTGVIATLVESAAPLAVFGVAAAITQQLGVSSRSKDPALYVFYYLFQGLFYSFCVSSRTCACHGQRLIISC